MRAWLVVMLCGCGRIAFDPLGGTAAPGDGALTGDGTLTGDGGTTAGPDGSTALSCTNPGDGTVFSGGGFCGVGWSPVIANAGLSVSGGMLQIAPNPNDAGATGGCERSSTLTTSGVFVHVIQPVPAATGETYVRISDGINVFEIYEVAGTLIASTAISPTSQAYDAVADQWWRLRPVGGHMWFEASPDAVTWAKLADAANTPPTAITIELGAITTGSEAMPGVALIGAIDSCP